MPMVMPPVPDQVRASGPAAVAAWRQGVEQKFASGWEWDARYGWLPPAGREDPSGYVDNYGPSGGGGGTPQQEQQERDIGLDWDLGPFSGGGGVDYDSSYWDDDEPGTSYAPSGGYQSGGGEVIPHPGGGGGGGDYQVQIVGPGGATPSRAQAIMAIVRTVLENTDIIEALRRHAGIILRGTPTYQGEPLRNPDVVYLLFEQLTKSQREAMVQYAAGVPAPVGLNQAAERDFLSYMVLDALQANGISPMSLRDKC